MEARDKVVASPSQPAMPPQPSLLDDAAAVSTMLIIFSFSYFILPVIAPLTLLYLTLQVRPARGRFSAARAFALTLRCCRVHVLQ
jgi:hypothetical protein